MFNLGWTDIPGPLLRIILVFVTFSEIVCVSLCVCGVYVGGLCVRVFVLLRVLPETTDLCLCVCALRLCLCVCVCGVSVTQCARKSCQRPYIFNIVDDFWLKGLQKTMLFQLFNIVSSVKAYKHCAFSAFCCFLELW